jgi:hypothetical protein
MERSTGLLSREYSSICVAQRTILYATKEEGDSGKLNVHGFVDANWAGDLDR